MTAPSSDLRARVLRDARTQPSRTRSALVKQRAIAAVLGLAWIVGFASFGHVRPDAEALALLGVWIAGALLASAYALFTPKSSLGRPRIALALLGPVVGGVVVLAAYVAPAILGGHSDDHHTGAGLCWLLSMGVALVPLALGLWVERRSDPIAPGASGAAMGAIAGAWGGVAMSFVCGRSEPTHVLAGHVLSLLAVVVLASVVGKRVLMLR